LPDVDVTSCPICARPVAVGTTRCPGCGTRLIIGVPAKRALAFVAIGLVVGLVAGSAATAVFASRVVAPPRPAPAASVLPAAVPTAVPPTPAPSTAPTPEPSSPVSPQAQAALGQVLVVNGRLAARAAELRAELAATQLDTFAIATSLRALAADAVVASGVTGMVGDWSRASDAARRLSAYYALVGSTATGTLGASLGDTAAYRDGARAMLVVLARLAPLEAAAEALAGEAGVALPSPSA
jgi:hypothetical protein